MNGAVAQVPRFWGSTRADGPRSGDRCYHLMRPETLLLCLFIRRYLRGIGQGLFHWWPSRVPPGEFSLGLLGETSYPVIFS
jgi:hypothetical protein